MRLLPDAKLLFETWYMDFFNPVNLKKLHDKTNFIMRSQDHILKVAMLLSLARDLSLEITKDDIEEAMDEVFNSARDINGILFGRPASQASPMGLHYKNVLDILLNSPGNTMDGGAVGTGAGTDLSVVNIVVMRDSFDLGLELASDLARHPTFRPEEIGRQLQQITSSLKVSYQDPGYLASTIMDRLVYGFHPYGVPSAGTPESVASLTRDDLVAFHREWFKANNALIAVVGDVKGDEAFAAVSKVFGDWARGDRPAQRFTDPPQPPRRVVVVDRPGAVQTEIRAGNVAIPRKHPDCTWRSTSR